MADLDERHGVGGELEERSLSSDKGVEEVDSIGDDGDGVVVLLDGLIESIVLSVPDQNKGISG